MAPHRSVAVDVGVIGVLGLAFLASGCESADNATATTPQASPPSTADDSWGTVAYGPLEEILGYADADTTRGLIDEVRQREDAIAACMAEEGFEYFPTVPEAADVTVITGETSTPREFAERYGYGVFNPVWESGTSIEYSIENPEQESYLSGLTESESTAYYEALYGARDADGAPVDPEDQGCNGEATSGVPGDPTLAAIQEAGAEFLRDLPDRAEFNELNEEWAECMGDLGYNYASPDATRWHFLNLDEQLRADQPDANEPSDLEGADDLAAEEIATATADVTCQEQVDYASRYNAIDFTLQQEYVDANRADLDLLIADS